MLLWHTILKVNYFNVGQTISHGNQSSPTEYNFVSTTEALGSQTDICAHRIESIICFGFALL
jgi:hypothetical protein